LTAAAGSRCVPSWKISSGGRSGPAGSAPGTGCRRRGLAKALGPVPRPGARVLRPAAGRGLPGHPRSLGDPGRFGGDTKRASLVPARAGTGADDRRLRFRRARPRVGPAAGLGVGDPRGLPRRPERRPRLRRPRRKPAAARGSRRIPAARARRRYRRRAGHHLFGCEPGSSAGAAGPGRPGADQGRLRGPGRCGQHHLRRGPARAGLQAVPAPVDVRGVDVAALDATGAAAVVLTPAHQWPTGVVLAPERRLALIDCAALACWPGYPAGSWPGPPGSASPPSPGPSADKPFCPSPRAPPGPTPPVSPLTAGPYCRPDPGGRQRDGNLPGQAQPGPGGRPGLGPRPGRQRPGHPQLPALDDPTRTIIGAPIVTAWGQRTGRGTWSGIWRMSASLGGGLVRLKRTLPSGRLAGPGVGHFPARP
jgi:hypothetical protein